MPSTSFEAHATAVPTVPRFVSLAIKGCCATVKAGTTSKISVGITELTGSGTSRSLVVETSMTSRSVVPLERESSFLPPARAVAVLDGRGRLERATRCGVVASCS